MPSGVHARPPPTGEDHREDQGRLGCTRLVMAPKRSDDNDNDDNDDGVGLAE